MKLSNTSGKTDWRIVMDNSLQVDYHPIPTGALVEVTNDDGKTSKQNVTQERIAFGFKTENGQGRAMTWIPVDELPEALATLQHYADNGVDTTTTEGYVSPAQAIRETISRVPSTERPGEYDISFRVRKVKGARSCRVPESDFAEFVSLVAAATEQVPGAVEQVMADRD